MVCGMLRKKNTGIILCRDSKETLVIIRGKAGDIAKNIATAMAKDETFRTVIAASVLVNKLEEGSGPALNESGLAELRKNLEKTIAEGGGEMKQFGIEKAKNGAAVCLRDGTPVKILDFDYNGNILYEIVRHGIKNHWIANNEGVCIGPFDDMWLPQYNLYMAPVYGFMNVYKNEANMILVGGVVRATLEECKEAGKDAPMENLKWFCVARVELLYEGEGGIE